ncbi:hypothetical protein Pint_35300 [Pistacia integerrima]|uniref:Uncharacterized protein n=1 Tax=Pistacia integerrima TaxID=434235 RepID=A0ACC0Y3R6_9ROSI|nr:hypothetical protein Pint_35300 [Pistacia integerrima]
MGISKPCLFLILIIMSFSLSHRPRVAEARPLSIQPQQRYTKIFETLGIACKCCDVSGNECSSTWTEPCSKLQCLPWKLQ